MVLHKRRIDVPAVMIPLNGARISVFKGLGDRIISGFRGIPLGHVRLLTRIGLVDVVLTDIPGVLLVSIRRS